MSTQLTGKILVVEDDIVNQKLTCSILKKVGLDFELACQGEEAIELWKKNNFNLILMDCQMPIMDGYIATQKIREMETNNRTPIIALTANSMENDDKRCINSGMDDFLSKPFTIQDLVSMLEKWLHQAVLTDCNTSMSFELNSEIIDELKEFLESEFDDVINIYIKSTSNIFKEMLLACSTNKHSDIQRLAHGLKSSSENVGAIKIATLAHEMEQQLMKNDFRNIRSKINEMNKIFILLVPKLKTLTT